MKKQLDQVAEFHNAFSVPVMQSPAIDPERISLRLKLLREEVDEFAEALRSGDIAHALKEWADILYILNGTALEFGFQHVAEPVFDEVHRSNMSKVIQSGYDAMKEEMELPKNVVVQRAPTGGYLLRREDGKIVKPSTYSPADVAEVLKNHLP